MKRIFIIASFLSFGAIYAQQGYVGINTGSNSADAPKATLEVRVSNANSNANTNEGIIVPKLTKQRVANIESTKRVEGTLVYVTDEVQAGDNATFTGTGKGFYYYDATAQRWVKMGAGSAPAVPEGSFTRNIRTDNRKTVVVDQLQDGSTPTVDYFIHMTGNPSNLTMPNVATNVGREICLYNPGGETVTVTPQPIGVSQSVQASATTCFISDGTNWINSRGY